MMNPEQTFFNKVKLEEKETMDRDGYDSRLLAAIQPAGGIRFHSAYIRTGSNYGAILTIYDWKMNWIRIGCPLLSIKIT